MRKLCVYIEINGNNVYVGDIIGNNSEDACFTYSESYLENHDSRAISIGLPLTDRTFDSILTRNYFEGLLPEGFTRRCVAEWMRIDENDYLSILDGLGRECLGALKIVNDDDVQLQAEYKELTSKEVRELAKEGATASAELVTKSHISLTGASGKVGLYYDGRKWYLPIGDAPSTHIVKQSHVRLKKIVFNEQLCLLTASKLGIETPESFIVNLDNFEDENILFATSRYDRKFKSDNRVIGAIEAPYRLHQEDFAQALGIPSKDKYEKKGGNYMRKAFEVLRYYSADPISDQAKLWRQCIFNYLIGNTDNHIKNISLLYSEDLKRIRLAPAYDIISTIIYDASSRDMSMSIGGEYEIDKINKELFMDEAHNIAFGKRAAMEIYDEVQENFKSALIESTDELSAQGLTGVDEICEAILQRNYLR